MLSRLLIFRLQFKFFHKRKINKLSRLFYGDIKLFTLAASFIRNGRDNTKVGITGIIRNSG